MAKFVACEPLLLVGQQILVGDVRSEEGGIVRIERNQQTRIEIAPQRVRGKRCANAGANIRGGVQFERDPALAALEFTQ